MRKRKGSFRAIGDDGRQYTIYIYVDLIDAGAFEDPKAVIEGTPELWTSDGKAVSYRQKGEYEILETGVVLRSSLPEAP
jgi:hypothetical protein